jgi:hypothetical protein
MNFWNSRTNQKHPARRGAVQELAWRCNRATLADAAANSLSGWNIRGAGDGKLGTEWWNSPVSRVAFRPCANSLAIGTTHGPDRPVTP